VTGLLANTQRGETAIRPRFPANVATIAILAAVYFGAAKAGLMLAFVHASATAVWPPTGIALAAILLLGYRLWPGVLLGAFLANMTTEGTVATSAGIAVGNTLEVLVGAYLVNRFAGGRNVFERPQHILRFAVLAGMVSTTVSATLGVTSLALGGVAPWSQYGAIWLTWWLGDASGALIVTPLLLLWIGKPRLLVDGRGLLEALSMLACLILIGQMVFGGWVPMRLQNRPIAFLSIPVLVWVAYRFGQHGTATAVFILSAVAIWGTLHGFGPFGLGTPNEALLLLQGFMVVTTVMAMVLAAAVAESRRGEAARSRLASIVESSHDAIIGKTLDGTILSWNSAATSLYGYTAEEAIGKPVSMLAPRHRQDEVPEILKRIRRGEQVDAFETTRMAKDGRIITVSLAISPFMDARGRILGAAAIARDVTERKRTEEAARRAETLLSVTRLANAAAHEINNPLTAILGPLQILEKEQQDGSESRRRLTMALRSAERIRLIVARMQSITKLEIADQTADLPERLDLLKSGPEGRKEP
jgi:PAS domain S-box-containing protein